MRDDDPIADDRPYANRTGRRAVVVAPGRATRLAPSLEKAREVIGR